MIFEHISRKFALSGCALALLLAGCGGGGGSTTAATTTPTTPTIPTTTEPQNSMWVMTGVDAVTASVKLTNASGVDLAGVQVLVSSVTTVNTSSDPSDTSSSATTKDVTLYNSSEDLGSSQAIANNSNFTFALKNVSFSAASTGSGQDCATAVSALGEVLLEVLDQGNELLRQTVQVCDLEGKTYTVSLK